MSFVFSGIKGFGNDNHRLIQNPNCQVGLYWYSLTMPLQNHQHNFVDQHDFLDQYFSLRFNPNGDRRLIKKAENLKKERLKELKYLYVYRDEKYVRQDLLPQLQSGNPIKLRLSDPRYFNDPSDSKFPDDYILRCVCSGDQLEYFKTYGDSQTRKKLSNLCEEPRNKFMDRLGIRCFSENPFLPRMWHCYAGQNKGVCLGYATEVLSLEWIEGWDPFPYIFPVRYSDNPRDREIDELNQHGTEYLTEHQKDRQMACSVLTKNTCWSHEQEWRWVMIFSDDSDHNDVFISQEVRDEYKNKLLPLSPRCIYTGTCMDSSLEDQLRAAAASRGIQVIKMKESDLCRE